MICVVSVTVFLFISEDNLKPFEVQLDTENSPRPLFYGSPDSKQ